MNKTLDIIYDIDNHVHEKYNCACKPHGETWLSIVAEEMQEIINSGIVGNLNEEVMLELTEENYHTACHAVRLLIDLRRYMI